MQDAKWENWLILLIGVWVCSIPWTLSFGFDANDLNVVMWNFLMVGGCVIMTSVIALRKLKIWTEWLSLFMGMWLIFSPLFLLYYNTSVLLWNSIIFGVLITGLSALAIPVAEKKRAYQRLLKRNAGFRHQ